MSDGGYKALSALLILVLVIALCVFISTELGGVITFLCVVLIYLGGVNRDFVQELVQKQAAGGGPAESALRLFNRAALAAPLEETTLTKVATGSDEAFRWLMQGMLQILPDHLEFGYIGRPERASPGEGYPAAHTIEQNRIIRTALDLDIPVSVNPAKLPGER